MPTAATRTRATTPAAASATTVTTATTAQTTAARRPAGRPAVRLTAPTARAATTARPRTEVEAPRPTVMPAGIAQLVAPSGAGEPLPREVRETLEASFGAGLDDVRVHTDPNSAAVATGMGARAFTYGSHVYLGPRERPGDVRLMAHEVAHVIQQQGRPVVQMCCSGCGACGAGAAGGSFEHEAARAASAVAGGGQFAVQGWTADAQVQKEEGGAEDEGLLTRLLWRMLEAVSPDFALMLREIMREGVLEWLKGKIVSAVGTVFDALASPVRAVTGVVGSLSSHFTGLLEWIREAAGKIARGDCSSITEAAERIQRVFEGLAAPVIDRIKHLAGRVSSFVSSFSSRFLAPIGEFLREAGGWAWEKIQQFGRWVWEKTSGVRERLSRAWRWIKNRLGIGEGVEGQNGLLQWVQSKAALAWDWIKARVEPIKRPLMVVGGILLMLSPAGPVIAVGAAVGGLMVGIRWIRQHMSRANGVVEQRQVLERTIIPAIMGAVGGVTSGLMRAASFVTDKLNGVMAGLGDAVSAVAGSVFRFAVGLIRWVAEQFSALVVWAREKLLGLADLVREGLERLRVFLQPIFDVLRRIAAVVGNIMQLPFLVAGRLWNAIPACIRDPFINFFIPLILGRIPLFSELVSTPEAWAQTRSQVMGIVRQIFRDHDLMGAMRSVFRLILRALAVPVDLAARVLAKAATAWDEVLARPIQFIRNILRSMLLGFRRFFGNIVSHLLHGVSGWIFGELRDVGIQPPSSWTDLRSVFGFLMQVLGITVEHIFELLARRLPPERVQQLRRAYNFLSGAWEWVKLAVEEGPAGVWRMLVERLRDLGTTVLRAAVDWMMERIVARVTARLLSMLDPTGVMAVVNALVSLYRAIQTVVRYMRQLLEIVNSVLDTVINVARGVLGPAAEMLEAALHRAMPIAIAFLANQVGLSGLGARMREIVGSIRERVDAALLWLIDRAMAGINAVMGMVRSAASAVFEWWRARKSFRGSDGRTHTAYFAGRGDDARLMIASDPLTVERLVAQRRAAPPALTQEQNNDLSLAVTAAADLQAYTRTASAQLSTTSGNQYQTNRTTAIQAEITRRLNVITEALTRGTALGGGLVPSRVTYSMANGKSRRVVADPLSKLEGNTHGEPTNSSGARIRGWEVVEYINSTTVSRSGKTTARDWRKVHLLTHEMHGPFTEWNVAWGRTAVNSAFLTNVENFMKDNRERYIFKYEVQVSYYDSGPDLVETKSDGTVLRAAASDFPQNFKFSLQYKDANSTGPYQTRLNNYIIAGSPIPYRDPALLAGQRAVLKQNHLKNIESNMRLYLDSRINDPLAQRTAYTWSQYLNANINRDVRREFLDDADLARLRGTYEGQCTGVLTLMTFETMRNRGIPIDVR